MSKKIDHINMRVSLIEFEENSLFFVYSPALDLTGYGTSPKAARDSYTIAMEEFLKYTANKETVLKELERLGWTISNSKIKAPTLPELIQSREYLEEIFTEKQYRKTDEDIAIPA